LGFEQAEQVEFATPGEFKIVPRLTSEKRRTWCPVDHEMSRSVPLHHASHAFINAIFINACQPEAGIGANAAEAEKGSSRSLSRR
jgi:hypothetical protein